MRIEGTMKYNFRPSDEEDNELFKSTAKILMEARLTEKPIYINEHSVTILTIKIDFEFSFIGAGGKLTEGLH